MIVDCTLWPPRFSYKHDVACCETVELLSTMFGCECFDLTWGGTISGAITVDEAVSLCQAVASGNTGTCSFFLLPQNHSSTNQMAVLAHRRLLEDKVVAHLSCS